VIANQLEPTIRATTTMLTPDFQYHQATTQDCHVFTK